MQLANLLSLIGLSGLVMGQQASAADIATVIIEQQDPTRAGTLINSTVKVPIDLLAQSPVNIVDPKLLSRFYLLAAPQVSCTPLFDTVPATPFPTIVGPSFTSKSSAAPPESAGDLNQAKLRFSCSDNLSAANLGPSDPPASGTIYFEKVNSSDGTHFNERHTIVVNLPGSPNVATNFSTEGLSRLILTSVSGADPSSVTCWTEWSTLPDPDWSCSGQPFGINVWVDPNQSAGPCIINTAGVGPTVQMSCGAETVPISAANSFDHANDIRNPANDVSTTSKSAVILRGTALSDQVQGPNYTYNIPVGQPSEILSVGLSKLYLASTSGVDVNAVTCTPVWTQDSSNATGPDFSFTVSSCSPIFVSNEASANLTIFCKDHLEDGTAVGVKTSALSGQPAARDVLRPRAVPSESASTWSRGGLGSHLATRETPRDLYDLSKCPDGNGPIGAIQVCECFDVGLAVKKFDLSNDIIGPACEGISRVTLGLARAHYHGDFPLKDENGADIGTGQVRVWYRENMGVGNADCDDITGYGHIISEDTCKNALELMIYGCPFDGWSSRGSWAIDKCYLWVLGPNDSSEPEIP